MLSDYKAIPLGETKSELQEAREEASGTARSSVPVPLQYPEQQIRSRDGAGRSQAPVPHQPEKVALQSGTRKETSTTGLHRPISL